MKKTISVILAVLMAISVFTLGAYAIDAGVTVDDNGNITIAGAGSYTIDADYTIPSDNNLTVQANGTLVIGEGVTLKVNGLLVNSGIIENHGTIVNVGNVVTVGDGAIYDYITLPANTSEAYKVYYFNEYLNDLETPTTIDAIQHVNYDNRAAVAESVAINPVNNEITDTPYTRRVKEGDTLYFTLVLNETYEKYDPYQIEVKNTLTSDRIVRDGGVYAITAAKTAVNISYGAPTKLKQIRITLPHGDGYRVCAYGMTLEEAARYDDTAAEIKYATVNYGDNFSFRVEVLEGYHKTDSFVLTIGGRSVTPNDEGYYTITNVTDTAAAANKYKIAVAGIMSDAQEERFNSILNMLKNILSMIKEVFQTIVDMFNISAF
ncbi:MAG: hypothetical protein K6G71_05975 [Clostridiales bacterium]|nr:hypothetical protein [Clostridiales bacterium]